jgi:hypothetical protein
MNQHPTPAVFKEEYCTCKLCCKKHGIERIEFFNNGSVAYREPPILPLGYSFPKYTYDYKRVKEKFDEVIDKTTIKTYFEELKPENKSLFKYSVIGIPTQFDPYPPGKIFEYESTEHDTEEEAKTDCMIEVLRAQFLLCVHEFRTDKKAVNFKYTYNKNGTEEDIKVFYKNQEEFKFKRIKEQVSLFYGKYYPKADDNIPRLKEYLKFDKFEQKYAYLYLSVDNNKHLHWEITFNPLDIKHEGMFASSIENKVLLNPFFNALERNKDGYPQCRFFTKSKKDEINILIQTLNPEMKKCQNKHDAELIYFCNSEEDRLSELVETSMIKIYHFMKQVYSQQV